MRVRAICKEWNCWLVTTMTFIITTLLPRLACVRNLVSSGITPTEETHTRNCQICLRTEKDGALSFKSGIVPRCLCLFMMVEMRRSECPILNLAFLRNYRSDTKTGEVCLVEIWMSAYVCDDNGIYKVEGISWFDSFLWVPIVWGCWLSHLFTGDKIMHPFFTFLQHNITKVCHLTFVMVFMIFTTDQNN